MTTDHNPLDAINTTDGNAERLATLKNLYPDLFTNEGKLNITELQMLADPNSINETEKFEFKWFGKSQAKRNAFAPTNATLVFDKARSVNPQNSQHIIIEGENLEVLKLLKEGYREKIKCIYIDPPYNTGKDFVYSDNFTQDKKAYWQDNGTVDAGVKVDSNSESYGRYHSQWLNMMFSRLLIARDLLREDGVIFISIDDNEVHHLRKLCDEVFGESCFVAQFPWRKRTAKSDVPFGVSQDFEWIICCGKTDLMVGIAHERKYYQTEDYLNDPWRLSDLTKQTSADERPNSAFDMVNPKTGKVYPFNPKRTWVVSKDTFESYYKKGKIVFPDDYAFLNITIPAYRVFESEDKAKALKKYGSENAMKAISTLLPKEVGMTEDGNADMMNLFGFVAFSFPKPVSLISYLIDIINDDEAIILDFFGGAGTTCHAVMELNKLDDGNRKSIIVQIPEQTKETSEAYKAGYKKISDITIARNQKVVEKLKTEGVETGFKVFKLAMSNFPRVLFELDPKQDEASNLARLQQYIDEKERQLFNTFDEANLLTEILIKRGFNLNYVATKAEQCTKNNVLWIEDGNKKAFVCLDDKLQDETVAYFTKNTHEHFICLERALDTTKKWNLKHAMGHLFFAF